MLRPEAIDEIRDAARVRQFDLLTRRARGGEGFDEFAKEFDSEIASLRQAWEEAVNENRRLTQSLQASEARLAVAESAATFRSYHTANDSHIAPEGRWRWRMNRRDRMTSGSTRKSIPPRSTTSWCGGAIAATTTQLAGGVQSRQGREGD